MSVQSNSIMNGDYADEVWNPVVSFESTEKIDASAGYMKVKQNQPADIHDTHDPHSLPNKKTSFLGASTNFYKACVGSGVLGIPYAYSLGWFQGLVFFTILPMMIIFTTILIVQNSQAYLKKEGLTLSQTVKQILGYWQEQLTIFLLIFLQWGCCASYLLFFIEFFNYAIYHTETIPIYHQILFLCLALCVITPLILVKDVGEFSKFSFISSVIVIAVLVGVIITSFHIIMGDQERSYNEGGVYSQPEEFSFGQIFFQAGIAMYTYEGIGMVFAIKSSMKKEQEFPKVVSLVGIVMGIQNLILGLGASFAFGQRVYQPSSQKYYGTQQIVLLSLNPSPFNYGMQILYSIALAITFPLQLFPIFQVVESYSKVKNLCNRTENVSRRTALRFGQVLMVCIFALSIPNFATLISFVGGIGGLVLQFLIPLMIYLKTTFSNDSYWRRFFIITICSFGIFLGAGATLQPFILPLPKPQYVQ